MAILNLKDKTARKFIKNQQNNEGSPREFHVKRIRKVGVLAELTLMQTYDFRKRLCEVLGIETEDMRVLLFDQTGKAAPIEKYRLCDEGHFGLYGKIKSEILNSFVSKEFDLLINYCDPELLFPRVIMLRSGARMIAGFEHEHNFFNDISISTKGNHIDTFNEELVKYLKILKLIG